MKISIVVVTHDTEVCEFFDIHKGAVVPKELRKDSVEYNATPVDAACSDDEIFKILLDAHGKHDAVGLLVEVGCEARFNACSSAVLKKKKEAKEGVTKK